MIHIGIPLSDTDFIKVKDFLAKIKPMLALNECQFQPSAKNRDFDRHCPLRHEEKVKIIKGAAKETSQLFFVITNRFN